MTAVQVTTVRGGRDGFSGQITFEQRLEGVGEHPPKDGQCRGRGAGEVSLLGRDVWFILSAVGPARA